MASPNDALIDRVAKRWQSVVGGANKTLAQQQQRMTSPTQPFLNALMQRQGSGPNQPFTGTVPGQSRGGANQVFSAFGQQAFGGGFGGGANQFRGNPFSSGWGVGSDTFNDPDWFDNRYKKDYREGQNKPRPPSGGDATGASSGVSGTQQWQSEIDRASEMSGVPWQVLASIMAIESGGQNVGTNAAGATGLMQVVGQYWQETANRFGGDLSDPFTNIRTAAEILKNNYAQYGSWEHAAAAYFGGAGAFNSDGSYSDNSDMYGTGISQYVTSFSNNMAYFNSNGWGNSGGQAGSSHGSGHVFPIQGYQGDLQLHWGEEPGAIDLFAAEGTPVLAMMGGTMTSGYSEIGGYWAYIVGDDGLVYYYAHMDRPVGWSGRVQSGQYLSGVGDTGNAQGTGAHLHLGIGSSINEGTGPSGGAGDSDVIGILTGSYRY